MRVCVYARARARIIQNLHHTFYVNSGLKFLISLFYMPYKVKVL